MLLMSFLLTGALFLLPGSDARIQLVTHDAGHGHKLAALHDSKGRLLMPLRSEAGQFGDSDMYYVKLPPSQHYYSPLSSKISHVPGTTHLRRLLPVSFASNGRPARVYHWNMPVLRRMAEQQQLQARRHSPATASATPKPYRRSNKKAGTKKADSPIYHIARFQKHRQAPTLKLTSYKSRAGHH